MRRTLLCAAAVFASGGAAHAEVYASLKGGYFFDDTSNALTESFSTDERTPQASMAGASFTYFPTRGSTYENWSATISGLWGRGKEDLRDVEIIRQDDELLIARELNPSVRFIGGYRYEFTGVRTNDPAATTIQPAPGLPLSAPATLLRESEDEVRHSLRLGMSVSAPLSFDGGASRHKISGALSMVGAIGRNSSVLTVDTDPGPAVQRQFIVLRENDIRRLGPEVNFAYRYDFTRRVSLDVGYRGTFLFDKLSGAANPTTIHGVTAALTYGWFN